MVVIMYRYMDELNENYWYGCILIIVSTVFNAAAGYVINDIYDVETDAINKPGKNVVDKGLAKKYAYIYYILLMGVSVGFSYFYSEQFAVINLCIMAILFFYAQALKGMPLIGNIFVAMCSTAVLACCVLQIAFDKSTAKYNFLGYIFFAFFISLIRELVKDMEDVEGDQAIGLRTWPIVFGIKGSKILVYVFTGIEILLCGVYSYLAWQTQFYISSIIMGLITAALIYFINYLSRAKKKEEFSYGSTILKILMFVGVLNILFS